MFFSPRVKMAMTGLAIWLVIFAIVKIFNLDV